MIPRKAASRALSLLRRFPAVGLLGPRQVGKTTLAHWLATQIDMPVTFVDLELPSDLAKLSDPEAYLAAQEGRLVVLDEIQRAPGLFQVLRSIVDERRRQGRRTAQFLLLGSASLDLLKQSAESLAGRIAYLELTPFCADEIASIASLNAASQDRLWVRGGFPESFLADSDFDSHDWRAAFIQTYLERDIPALGPRIPAETLRRLWTMLCHDQGTLLNASRLAGALGVSGQTVARYLDLLVDLLLVRRLTPWAANGANGGKRLVRSPKVYVRDSGLVHALLNLRTMDDILGHSVAGSSWEGFVIENIIGAAPPGTQAWFYRTSAGAEIDLLLELSASERWAIEVKRSRAPTVSRGFHLGCADVGATQQFVVYPGDEMFSLGNSIKAVPLLDAMNSLRRMGDPPPPLDAELPKVTPANG